MVMPITVDDFDHLPEMALDLTEGSNAQRVQGFFFHKQKTTHEIMFLNYTEWRDLLNRFGPCESFNLFNEQHSILKRLELLGHTLWKSPLYIGSRVFSHCSTKTSPCQ